MIAAALALAVLFSMPWWAPALLSRLSFFRLRDVEVVGARYIPADEIVRLLGVDTVSSVWQKTRPLELRVATHPQVASVEITRKLPGTLVIHITENMPVAFVPSARGMRALDAVGRELPIDASRMSVDLPVIARRDTMLLRLLADMRDRAPELFQRLSGARRAARNELVLDLDSIAVRATRDLTAERLADILPVEVDLARRQARVAELDLRFREQVIARLQ